ncbi:hypothetical protein HRU87_02600 [Aquiluna borgnonia]|uniref:Uncharacterized protein n=1 Tax=Aquiluna borgnonia TaxID=2499157 RepID=A0A7D4QMK4_9MICO|nr:hypothetical protein [Aquiluna borgnonia]QKJ25107.1 hypothetical protein HRU87_02600 [Aquiluna borgnonia]
MNATKLMTRTVAISLIFSATAAPSVAEPISGGPEPSVSLSVTATVDGDGELCTGYGFIELSAATLNAQLERVIPGIEPSPWELLAGSSDPEVIADYQDYALTENEERPVFYLLPDDPGSLAVLDEARNRNDLNLPIDDFDNADTNGDGLLNSLDVSELRLTRQVFSTAEFDVTFDANNCPSSEEYGLVSASRDAVEVLDSGTTEEGLWTSIEQTDDSLGAVVAGTATQSYVAKSYLLTTASFIDEDVTPFLLYGPDPYYLFATGLGDLLFPSGPRRVAPEAGDYSESDLSQNLFNSMLKTGTQGTVGMTAIIATAGEIGEDDVLRTSYDFELSKLGEGNDLQDLMGYLFFDGL